MNKIQTLAVWAIKNGYSCEYSARGQSVDIERPDGAVQDKVAELGLWSQENHKWAWRTLWVRLENPNRPDTTPRLEIK